MCDEDPEMGGLSWVIWEDPYERGAGWPSEKHWKMLQLLALNMTYSGKAGVCTAQGHLASLPPLPTQ